MIDDKKVEQAVRLFLEGVGENLNREGLVDTPQRIVRMTHELFRGKEQTVDDYFKAKFSIEESGFISINNIEFYSLCEHHLLPYFGYVHIGYMPKKCVLGLSKFYRIVDLLAAKPTIQEQFTNEIATTIYEKLNCEGIVVAVNACHMCARMRGVKKTNSVMSTKKVLGNIDQNTLVQFYNQVVGRQ